MTDQERDPEADGPEDATDPEPEATASGAAADETEMTDDADAADEAADEEGLSADDEDEDDERLSADDEDVDQESGAPFDDEDAAAAGPSATATAKARAAAGQRRTKGTSKLAPAPTVADDAVHIQDRVSSWFVIASVGVFVVILAWALLLGRNGIMSDVFATPKPIATPVETVIPSAEPSVEPSVAPSTAPSVAPESPGAVESPTAS